MPRPIEPGEMHSYAEWLQLGYQVQRGERHVARNAANIALFSSHQVAPQRVVSAPTPRGMWQRAPTRVRRPQERGAIRAAPVQVHAMPYEEYFRHSWMNATTSTSSTSSVFTTNYLSWAEMSQAKQRELERSQRVPEELVAARKEVWEISKAAQQAEMALRALDRKFRRLVPADEEPSGLVKLLKGGHHA